MPPLLAGPRARACLLNRSARIPFLPRCSSTTGRASPSLSALAYSPDVPLLWPCLVVFMDMDSIDIFIVARHCDLPTPCHTRPPPRLTPAAEQQHARHSLISLTVVFNNVETLLYSTCVACSSECVTGLLDLAVGCFASATVYPTSIVTLLFSPGGSLPTPLPGEASLFLSYSLNRGWLAISFVYLCVFARRKFIFATHLVRDGKF